MTGQLWVILDGATKMFFLTFSGLNAIGILIKSVLITMALLEALKEMGLELFDQNGERQVGASLMQHSTQDGQRVSANDAFIRPIRGRRKNLVVRPRSYVTRLLIDPKTKTAYGVEYNENGQLRRSYARKEVIVSSGVINSPQILMLSGIGPAEELREFRIPLIKDLRVGYNLHDHTTVDGIIIGLSNITATTASPEQVQNDISYYQKTRRGPISGTSTLQVNAFMQTKYERDYDRPDIQLSLDPSNTNNYITDPILTALTNVLPTAYYDAIAVRPVLLAPKSRGVIRLNRTHPVYGPPLIYANTFSEREDFERLLEGINQGVSLGQTKTFEGIGAGTIPYPMPACKHLPWNTREYWSCVLIAYTTTLYHPVGTCKMGPKTDPHAVVSPELKVYGVRRLRVIDGSIMPVVPRANTNTATLMIAEKGCDMIKADWLRKDKPIYPTHSINPNIMWKGWISNVKSALLKALAV